MPAMWIEKLDLVLEDGLGVPTVRREAHTRREVLQTLTLPLRSRETLGL